MPRRLLRWLSALSVEAARPAIRWWDWAVSVTLLALSVVEVLIESQPWPVARLAAAAVAAGVLPFRRRIPLETFAVAFVAQGAVSVAATIADVDTITTLGQDVAGIMLVYALCRWDVPRRVAVGLAVGAALLFGDELLSGVGVLEALAFLIPWAIVAGFALAMRYRARLRESELAQVRLAERNVLARELHDSVAHHVSAIAVQAQAARFVASENPTAAVDAIASIEATANEAIDEMRRMVGVLRSDDDERRTVTPTTLEGLADPDGDPRVVLTGSTDLAELSAPVATAVFRIAQESITNARRHSDGVTFVDVQFALDDDQVELEVVNDGSPTARNSGSGYGIVGMEERVAALGGQIDTGPRPARGWRVAISIPKNGAIPKDGAQ